MSTDERFGWCFIGCGTLATIVARQITDSGRHRIVSVYGRRQESAEAFAEEFGAAAYSSAREAVSAPGVEGVYVVTPHRSHAEYAGIALENGKPVLCEKAFTVNAGDAEKIIELAKEKKVYLAEAMWTWFSPIARQVKKWIAEGEFGEVRECVADMRSNGRHYAPRVTDPEAAGGALLDLGVYGLCYVYKLFGKPEDIRCEGTIGDGIDWSEEITLNYPGDRKFRILSSICDEGIVQSLRLQGTKASLELPEFHYASHAEFTGDDGAKREITADGSYLNEFDLVASEIREGLTESRYMPFQDTMAVMELMDECRRQMGLVYPFE